MTPRRTPLSAALLGLIALSCTTRLDAQQRDTPPTPGPAPSFVLPRGREFTLSNGLGVTLVPFGDVPKAWVLLAFLAGSADDPPGQLGLAELASRTLQQGTTTRSEVDIARAVAQMGGLLVTGTATDETEIAGLSLSEFTPRMIALVADLAIHPAVSDSAVSREARAWRAWWGGWGGDALSSPQWQAMVTFRSALYGASPYGGAIPSGNALAGITSAQVRSFWTSTFGAARAHLYVVGRFDADSAERAARMAFADWAAGPPPDLPGPQATAGRRVLLVDRPGASQSTVYVGLPVIDPTDPDYLTLVVTDAVLGARITANIRENKGYTYNPGSELFSDYRHAAYWDEAFDAATRETGAALAETLKEIRLLRATPPSAAEVHRVESGLAARLLLRNRVPGAIVNQLAFLRLQGLPDSYLTTYVPRVQGVTPDEVQRAARNYLDPARMSIVVVGDRRRIERQLARFGPVQVVNNPQFSTPPR
jgi:zinc protease